MDPNQPLNMYPSILLPWSATPSAREAAYRTSGLLKTRGTLYLFPPSEEILRATFDAPPRPKSRMSSGAVALCKHFERGSASSEHGTIHPFWTLPKGSNDAKTAMASETLDQMLRDTVWKNVMVLHAGVAVYEIRNMKGFGMRWTLEIEEMAAVDAEGYNDRHDKEISKVKDAEKDWVITTTKFRGFLEPIEGLDHELPQEEVMAETGT